MAGAFLKSFDPNLEVFSAGTHPAGRIHPKTIEVMREVGIGLSDAFPKDVDQFLSLKFDYVITVCDHARETCPVFTGIVTNRIHLGFDDPAEATGSEEEIISAFRRVRDEIREIFFQFYQSEIKD
jgi:arsenate reductase